MSRFFDDCYDEDFPNQAALYEANTERALKGKRGQAFLREMEAALLALPRKRLIEGNICMGGEVCAIGALALKRLVDGGKSLEAALAWLEERAPHNSDAHETADFAERHFKVLERFSFKMAYVNDEHGYTNDTPEQRYDTVLGWVRENIDKARI